MVAVIREVWLRKRRLSLSGEVRPRCDLGARYTYVCRDYGSGVDHNALEISVVAADKSPEVAQAEEVLLGRSDAAPANDVAAPEYHLKITKSLPVNVQKSPHYPLDLSSCTVCSPQVLLTLERRLGA